ncbi:rhomboid family intramembrane serine protease, partial [Candidatus Bathyarchaeota archaeon]
MSNSQKFKPTYIIIALNIAVYAYTSFVGGNFFKTDYSVLLQYGQVNDLVINS